MQRSFRQYFSGIVSAFTGHAPVDERREEPLAALRVDLDNAALSLSDGVL